MAGDYDRERILAIRSAHGTNGFGTTDLSRNLAIGPGFAERNCRQRLPHFFLKSSARDIELNRKPLALSGEVVVELARSLTQHGMVVVFHECSEFYPARGVVFPEDCCEAAVAGNEFQHANRRFHRVVRISL